MYFKLHTIFRDDKREWSRFCEIESKVRESIEKTVLRLKAAPLNSEKSVWQWLVDLKQSRAPTKSTTKQSIKDPR